MAFALSLDTQTNHALSIHTTTLFIVLLTVMVMGGATGPLLILLDIKPQTAEDDEPEDIAPTFWVRIDRRYVRYLSFSLGWMSLHIGHSNGSRVPLCADT